MTKQSKSTQKKQSTKKVKTAKKEVKEILEPIPYVEDNSVEEKEVKTDTFLETIKGAIENKKTKEKEKITKMFNYFGTFKIQRN